MAQYFERNFKNMSALGLIITLVICSLVSTGHATNLDDPGQPSDPRDNSCQTSFSNVVPNPFKWNAPRELSKIEQRSEALIEPLSRARSRARAQENFGRTDELVVPVGPEADAAFEALKARIIDWSTMSFEYLSPVELKELAERIERASDAIDIDYFYAAENPRLKELKALFADFDSSGARDRLNILLVARGISLFSQPTKF